MVTANVDQVALSVEDHFCFSLGLLPLRLGLTEKLPVQFSHRGQLYFRCIALKQLCTQFLFQMGNLAAHGLSGHKQLFGRLGKAF